eukprot:435330-Alexandrium_andersonii.AAC.2
MLEQTAHASAEALRLRLHDPHNWRCHPEAASQRSPGTSKHEPPPLGIPLRTLGEPVAPTSPNAGRPKAPH